MSQPFENKIALVTGASSGIGEAISEALSIAGCDLCLVGRNMDRLNAVADRLRKNNSTVQVIQADLTVTDDITRLADALKTDPARLDILIHSAGSISWGPIEDGHLEAFDAQFHCNARSPYLLTKALLPLLRTAKGQIVFVNSTAGLNGKANAVAYSASKHALKGLANALREEVNADGVRVLSAFLGKTDTPMQEEISRAKGTPYNGGHFLRPQDVATVLLPLLSLPPSAEVTDLVLRPLVKSFIGAATATSMRWLDTAASAVEMVG